MAAQSNLLPTTRADPRIYIPTENVLPWDSQLRRETEAWTQKMIKNHWLALQSWHQVGIPSKLLHCIYLSLPTRHQKTKGTQDKHSELDDVFLVENCKLKERNNDITELFISTHFLF